jgi:hypothetical protein
LQSDVGGSSVSEREHAAARAAQDAEDAQAAAVRAVRLEEVEQREREAAVLQAAAVRVECLATAELVDERAARWPARPRLRLRWPLLPPVVWRQMRVRGLNGCGPTARYAKVVADADVGARAARTDATREDSTIAYRIGSSAT